MTALASPARTSSATCPPRAIGNWLLIVAAIVFVMVVIGGITRLTESGLSMVRWQPISGIVPPLNAEQWAAEFRAYQATPEYQKVNAGMTLDQFKSIFFWEYLHRVIGRIIGLAMILPLGWLAWKRSIPQGYGLRLTALAALVVFQGAIGWWMVASGLVDRPDVSHIRLSIHLLTAFFFFGGLIWTALDLFALDRTPTARPARFTGFATIVMSILAIQLLLGALTAGLDAGFAFATWPLMGDTLFPAGGWNHQWGLIANAADNPVVVQFIHRWWAWITAAAMLLLARRARAVFPAAPLLIGALIIVQILLGIATLLSGVSIPIAVTHQAVALILLAVTLQATHAIGQAR